MHEELMFTGYLDNSKPCWLNLSLLDQPKEAQKVTHLAKEPPKAMEPFDPGEADSVLTFEIRSSQKARSSRVPDDEKITLEEALTAQTMES